MLGPAVGCVVDLQGCARLNYLVITAYMTIVHDASAHDQMPNPRTFVAVSGSHSQGAPQFVGAAKAVEAAVCEHCSEWPCTAWNACPIGMHAGGPWTTPTGTSHIRSAASDRMCAHPPLNAKHGSQQATV